MWDGHADVEEGTRVKPANLLLLALLGGLLFLMFFRTRKQQREVRQTQARLMVGAEVMTTAGLYATVAETDERTVVLETAPGQRSRWDRRAIARVIPQESLPAVMDVDAEAETETDLDKGAIRHGEFDPESGDGGGSSPPDLDTAPPDRA
jgi:preprotein translocase subunit YajC